MVLTESRSGVAAWLACRRVYGVERRACFAGNPMCFAGNPKYYVRFSKYDVGKFMFDVGKTERYVAETESDRECPPTDAARCRTDVPEAAFFPEENKNQ